MHLAALHLVPILGAEKSKVAFYVAGGLLALWAITLSVGIGLRTPDFPGNARGQRAIIAVSAVLMVAAMSTAVITSGGAASANAAKAGAPSAAGVASTLSEAADPAGALKFVKSKLTVPAGRVTVDFANMSQIPHNMTIAQGSTVLGATPTFQHATKTLTLSLKPGTYVFYCSVPGHRQAGMQGTLTVTAGGASAPPPSAGAASTLSDSADPAGALKFTKSTLTAHAGNVKIDFANMSQIPHNMTIAQGSTVLGATPTFTGATKSLTLNLKPGKYVFYCSVPGHRQAGMQGTLTVSP